MSENTFSWIIMFVLLCVGFGLGWWVHPDNEPQPVQSRAALECYRDYDAYVRQQVEWLQKHNAELRAISELDAHNNEVKDGAVESK